MRLNRIQKNYRLDEVTVTLLDELALVTGCKLTAVIEDAVKGYYLDVIGQSEYERVVNHVISSAKGDSG